MFVVATAGHVDHGKSTLVRALTGMEPDRLAEEQRRGMTIELGFVWTALPSGAVVAFVDVPGHQRFVPTMLAGAGPVPAALVVVAADEGWMPQSAEHLAALDGLGVRHGLIAVTRSDLADFGPALERARAEVAATSMGTVEAVAVSGTTGSGLAELRAALDRLGAALPPPDPGAPVRLWVDRSFTIRGSGTVVTGTLGAGTLTAGDELEIDGRTVRVRALESLGRQASTVAPVARVAVNLRGIDRSAVRRGTALVTPDRFTFVDVIDVRVHGDPVTDLPATVALHVGSAAVPAHVRPLGTDTARLRLDRPLPLRIGDRALLRDPGRHHVAGGLTVLDVAPPPLGRRGSARDRADELSTMDARPDATGEIRRRRVVRRTDLIRMGVPDPPAPLAGDWLIDPAHADRLAQRLADAVAAHDAAHPLDPGLLLEAARHTLGLPDRTVVTAVVRPPLTVRGGRVTAQSVAGNGLPEPIARAVAQVERDLASRPFAAPDANRLTQLGLGRREVAVAVRAGALVRAGDVVLLPGAVERAADVLASLPQPFTLSTARQALGTSRRVAVPLLELLDQKGVTRRLPDDTRVVVDSPATGPSGR
ncbi:selenocysteine-specific translation elongation factor [Virgisporangium aurantiacum]|uniref:Selenocysteine-specific translation elongation factor n=1 Tax=Virgisporangium aurantiacum TaxID=175570 RepID=A0A8J3Z4S5_9ACTN|nr:selenocysteine-specific translation elongation factor [Virgisporangium aurantiacum]GIJ55221.1 selenocysteine-specific translation elongation factor [Virgisporangium aurantiacum]